MSRTHGGKGDGRRATQISQEENDLRWELIKATSSRKRAILKRLKEIENVRQNCN
jgi:hypothetical protein